MSAFVVHLRHWLDVEDEYLESWEGVIDVEVEALTEAEAVESVRAEYARESWDAWAELKV